MGSLGTQHCVQTRATVVLIWGNNGKGILGAEMPCWPIGVILASLSKLCLHIPQELKRAEQLWYTIWYGLLLFALYYMLHFSRKKEPIFTFILSRKNGWKKICLSIQNHGFKSIFIALLEMALSCWYFGALKGQSSRGW